MKLLFLLSVSLLITTHTWAYSPDCRKGPDYWCRDQSTAEECGALLHCQQYVWRDQHQSSAMKIDSTAQMLCNVLAQASKELLSDGLIQVNTLKDYLRKDCTKLPNQKSLIQQCQSAVDTYLTDIIKHIQTGTDVAKICPIIQGKQQPSKALPKAIVGDLTTNATCILCEFIIHILQTFASANSSAQELATILENTCQLLPTVLRSECKTFIATYGFDIIAILVREFDPTKVCELIKVCPKSYNVAFLTKSTESTCGLCEYVTTYLEAGFSRADTCKHFPTENNEQQQCEILTQLYKPNLCPQLQICQKPTASKPVESSIQSTQCTLCKFIISYLDHALGTNTSQAAIVAALEKVCTILPTTLKDECKKFVDTFGPKLFPFLVNHTSADQVCNALKVCNNGTEIIKPVLSTLNLESTSVKSTQCTLCKFIISYLEHVLDNNRSEAAIESALEKVCTILPSTMKDKCEQFVEGYGPILVQILANYTTPDGVCNVLKVCNNGTVAVKPVSASLVIDVTTVKSVECSLCKYIVGYIDTIIQNNKSEAAIEAALEKVCTIVPADLKQKCTNFVDTYGPFLAELLMKFTSPEAVCHALKMCIKESDGLMPVTTKIQKRSIEQVKMTSAMVGSVECSLCKYVVSYLDTVIKSNRSEAAVEAALDKVCEILPPSTQEKCKQFVVLYGPVLPQLIIAYATPEQVCDALYLCHNGTEVAKPVVRPIISAVKKVKNSAECTLCKYVLSYINVLISSNASAQEVEKALEVVCSILPSQSRGQCTSFVQQYGPILVELVAELDDPNFVCAWLGLCPKSSDKSIEAPAVKRQVTTLPCKLCQYVVNYFDVVIQSNATETDFEQYLDHVCKVLPDQKTETACETFVKLYGNDIIKFLVEHAEPSTVCQKIGICEK